MKLVKLTLNVCMAMMLLTGLSNCTKESAVQIKDSNDAAISGADNSANQKPQYYTAHLEALNHSGVSGKAMLTLHGHTLTVEIMASGLEPGMLHVQHIHGFTENNKNAKCPDVNADTDGDGLVTLAEGLPYYGAVLLPLTPFPTAGSDGMVHYTETFDLSDGNAVSPLQNRAIVLHGLTVQGEYVATLPVACAQIMRANGNME